MNQRVRFVSEHSKAYFPITELCAQFEISRKTGYKWLRQERSREVFDGLVRTSTSSASRG